MVKSFFRIESYKRGILFSSGFNIIAKALTFSTNILIAFFFGTQAKTDVYFYCYSTITLMASFISSMDSAVLIPESMRLREQKSDKDSKQFLNFFLYLYFIIGLIITLFLFSNPVAILTSLSHFKKELLYQNNVIITLSIPLFTLIIACTFLVDVLTSYKFFTIPMIAQMFNSIFSIIFVLLFHNSWNVLSILIGLLSAYVMQFILLIILMKKYLHWEFNIKIIKIDKRILKNILYAQSGNITSTLTSYIPLYLLSGFSAGVITALNYGQKTADIPNQFITTQFSTVTAIKYNELVAKRDKEGLNKLFNDTAKLLLFLLTPISFFIYLFNKEIITILYNRGKFDVNSVKISAEFLKYFSLLNPFLAINTLVARLLMAHQKVKEGFYYQVLSNILFVIIIIFAINNMGIMGYPIALLIGYVFTFIMTYYFLRIIFKNIEYGRIIVGFAKITILNILMYLSVNYIKICLVEFDVIFQILIVVLVYSVILIFVNRWVKIIPKII